MKILIQLDGTPDELRGFLAAGLTSCNPDGGWVADHEDRAREMLQTAVKNGRAEILLGEVTDARKLEHAGCI